MRTDFADIMYTVVAEPSDYYVSYKIYHITGYSRGESGEFDVPCYEAGDDQFCESLDEADVFAHGDVKWDGCSNWHFDECERVMIHGCARSDLTDIGEVLARCWDMTATLCPNWSESVATR